MICLRLLIVPIMNNNDSKSLLDSLLFTASERWDIDEEQITQLAKYMREVHEKKKKDSLNINQAGVDTAKRFSWENSAKKILDAIEKNDKRTNPVEE